MREVAQAARRAVLVSLHDLGTEHAPEILQQRGNVSAAAREIGISRQRAQRLLEATANMDGNDRP
jgi:ActR/RegA family two-component response regulator